MDSKAVGKKHSFFLFNPHWEFSQRIGHFQYVSVCYRGIEPEQFGRST